jgi:hypothetical protein
MRSELRDRGVRHLVAGSAVRETAGNQYFQFLLGYEVRNLVITVDPHPAQILNLVRPGSSCGQGGAPEVGDSQLKESANS